MILKQATGSCQEVWHSSAKTSFKKKVTMVAGKDIYLLYFGWMIAVIYELVIRVLFPVTISEINWELCKCTTCQDSFEWHFGKYREKASNMKTGIHLIYWSVSQTPTEILQASILPMIFLILQSSFGYCILSVDPEDLNILNATSWQLNRSSVGCTWIGIMQVLISQSVFCKQI